MTDALAASDGIRLTEWTTCGGCAAKWGAGLLRSLLVAVAPENPDGALLVGLAPFDDAAVLQLSDDLALVSTTDFFPPLVDDPEDFGAIAAANACSDVFAMGGQVRLALNVAAFPERLPPDAIAKILASAAAVVAECGGTVAGGHTIRSDEPIFGLAVQGVVHPARIWTKGGAQPGDALVLSKPLGTGIVLASGDSGAAAAAIRWMRRTNRAAAAQLAEVDGGAGPRACTDVTGYGLVGHGVEIAERSGASVVIEVTDIPLHEGAEDAAARGVRTGGDARNRAALEGSCTVSTTVPAAREALCYDPQTSGGLLAAVSPAAAAELVSQGWWRIGAVATGPPGVVLR